MPKAARTGIGLVAVTAAGRAAAAELETAWPDACVYPGPARDALAAAFAECRGVVVFLAVGAAVRLLAPLLTDKHDDPGVVCVDEGRRFAVPVVGGHVGGANELAGRVAEALGAIPVVTTASEATGTTALDTFGADCGFTVEPGSDLAAVGAAILDGRPVAFHADATWPTPPLPGSVHHAGPLPANPVPAANPLPPGATPAEHSAVPMPDVSEVEKASSISSTSGVPNPDRPTDPLPPGPVPAGPTPAEHSAVRMPDVSEVEKASSISSTSGVPNPDRPTEATTVSPVVAVTDRLVDVPTSGTPNPDRSIETTTMSPVVAVTDRLVDVPRPAVVYRPPSLVVGVGASRGAPTDEILGLVDEALTDAGLSAYSVRHLATVDAKRDEPGIVAAARARGWPLVAHPAATLAGVAVPNPSEVVRAAVGTPSVAEAACLLGADGQPASPGAELVVPKRASARATVAVARHRPRGRLAIVGIGPGERGLLTSAARAELARASVVVGLDQYVEQVADLLRPGVTVLASGLGEEESRAATAVAQARAGHAVALVGSGDAGVYAMASPALAVADATFDVVGVPGVTAALAAAALLGAPLGNDHALVSLSDLHTPWEVIATRVRAVAEADLVVAFYNPRSRTRTWQLGAALGIIAAHRPADTPVGIVTDAYRRGQRVTVTTLAGAAAPVGQELVGMTTTVVVGSSATRVVAGRVVTPRGYRWS